MMVISPQKNHRKSILQRQLGVEKHHYERWLFVSSGSQSKRTSTPNSYPAVVRLCSSLSGQCFTSLRTMNQVLLMRSPLMQLVD